MAGLREYRHKRNFRETPEPGPRVARNKKKKLIFVVQEHHASHLHYDFRLEWDGVLKSWAVPKGPSQDPGTKRLAVEVEDHPVSYAKFHGVIPEHQYGAGTVEIWDEGFWEPIGDVEASLAKGHLEFTLKGNTLTGRWLLQRTKLNGGKKPQWLLIKRTDEFTKADMSDENSELTHSEKILYPSEKITKGQVADYFEQVRSLIMPFIEDRPVSLFRCPSGVQGSCFFQKHAKGDLPKGLRAFPIKEKQGEDDYIVPAGSEALQAFAQLGALELHVWNSRIQEIEKPDQIVMDFDPDPNIPWNDVVDACFMMKEILGDMGLASFVKLTGGKGVHVQVPLLPHAEWDDVLDFSRLLSEEMVAREPDLFLNKVSKSARKGKIFVDYLRNARGSTAVAPYSLRSKKISAVAMPVEWDDLKKYGDSAFFTLEKALWHLAKRRTDPWNDYRKLKQEIPVLH